MFRFVVELDGESNQRVLQQSRQGESILHGRNDNDNDKVRFDLNTSSSLDSVGLLFHEQQTVGYGGSENVSVEQHNDSDDGAKSN